MTAHWGQPDPAATEGTEVEKHLAFADAFRMLYNRISIFTALPMKSLDMLSLQRSSTRSVRPTPSRKSLMARTLSLSFRWYLVLRQS